MHTYDLFGWYAAEQFPARPAPVAPPDLSQSEVDGALRANWTGHAWLMLPYSPPPELVTAPTVPAVVTRAQFKLALLDLDLLDDVEALVAGTTNRALQINWAERLEFERNHPLVIATAAALGKTEAEIDALFVLAATK